MYEVNFEEGIHCGTQEEAKEILIKVTDRFEECGLRVHPQNTKIVYCKKEGRKLKGLPVQFDFLGFSFRPIMTRLRKGGSFLQCDCKMVRKSKKRILKDLRSMEIHRKTGHNIGIKDKKEADFKFKNQRLDKLLWQNKA